MATSAHAKMSARQLRRALPLVDRFLVREARVQGTAAGRSAEGEASTSYQAGSLATEETGISMSNPHAFQPYKHPVTGRWLPPRLSLRRQAQLAKAAYRDGVFDDIVAASTRTAQQAETAGLRTTRRPPSTPTGSRKMDKMVERLQELSANDADAPLASYSDVLKAKARRAAQRAGDADGDVAQQDPREVYKLAHALAATSRPYRGRSMRAIFKGTKAEREAPARKRNIAERLSGMEQTVEAWRQAKKEAKLKQQPKLPF